MKTFKQHLTENENTVSPSRASIITNNPKVTTVSKSASNLSTTDDRADEKAVGELMAGNANIQWSKGQIPNGDISWEIANELNPKPSMPREKAWNTDVGLAFDQDPSTGELYGNQSGFKAVRAREKEGKGFNFINDYKISDYRKELLNKLNPFK